MPWLSCSGGVYVSESDQNNWQTVVVTFYGILNLLQDLVCITMSDIFLYSIHANVCPLSAISPIKNLYNIHLWNVYIHVACRMLPVPDSKRYICLLPFCLLIPKWVLLAFSLPHHKVNRHRSLHSNRISAHLRIMPPKMNKLKNRTLSHTMIMSGYCSLILVAAVMHVLTW